MKHSLFILSCFFVLTVSAQTTQLLIAAKASYFTVDKRSNIYYINEKNEIIKYDITDSTEITYSNKTLGKPQLIDVSNPMKILVFYPDYSTVVLLDNTLSQITSIKLTTLNGTTACQPLAVCRESESDFIWMYDALSRKLIRFDETGTIAAESEPFDELFNFSIESPHIFSGHNKVGLLDQVSGLFVFDIYANYISTQYITTSQITQFNGQYLILTDGYHVQGVDLDYPGAYIQVTDFTDAVLECTVMNGTIFSLRADGIYITKK